MSGVCAWVTEWIDIGGLIIDFLGLIATIALTIAIYLLERRHEKEHEKTEEESKKLAVIEAAKVFLIDNDEEIEYLPLAEIAAKLKLKRKHCRKLITRYLRCDDQQQQEILRQANIPDIHISMNDVQAALKSLQADLDKFRFGKSILYDGGKYLHRAFERWSETPVEEVNPFIFEDIRKSEWHDEKSGISWRLLNGNTSLFSYMWDYLHPEDIGIDKYKIQPPIDMVFQHCNLGACEEKDMTFWTMRIIIDACYAFSEQEHESIFDEALIQTQEDMYYYTLAVLCQTYIKGGKENSEQIG